MRGTVCVTLFALWVACSKPASPAAPDAPSASPPAAALRLLVVTNLNGTLEPCGCSAESAGGLDRLAGALEAARTGSTPTLFLVAGPTFFDPRKAGALLPLQERWEAAAMADALGDLRVDAALLDARDVDQAGPALRELARRAKFPLLSSQAVETLEAAPLATRMFERGAKVFVLSAPPPTEATGFSASALKELDERIAEARSKGADLVVGMVSAPREQTALLAKETRADVWIAATSARAAGASAQGHGVVLEAGLDGEQLLIVDLGLGTDSEPLHIVSPGGAKRGRWIAWKSVRLDSTVRPDPAFSQRLRTLAKKINEYNAAEAAAEQPSVGTQGAFAGSSPCGACHTAAYLWWRSSAHGRAYRSLQRVDKEFNLDCVGCHVTGYRKPGGATLARLEDLTHVGCESCHGPSAAHVDNPRDKRRPSAEVPAATCRECHDPQHSPDFEEARYRLKLRARGHGLPLGG